jgi:hypothetical protein
MSRLALTRLNSFQNSATTNVVAAATSSFRAKPMIDLADDHDHHHEPTIALPNKFKPSTSHAFSGLLSSGNLRVTTNFNSMNSSK